MIKDSGDRREFDTGAVRDMAEGKGRMDLLPLEEVAEFLSSYPLYKNAAEIIRYIAKFQKTLRVEHIYSAIYRFMGFCADETMDSPGKLLLELAVHFEEGAKKYEENNWKKGIPTKFYIDSGVRHLLKYTIGLKDERHDRAFCWNMFCLIWSENSRTKSVEELSLKHRSGAKAVSEDACAETKATSKDTDDCRLASVMSVMVKERLRQFRREHDKKASKLRPQDRRYYIVYSLSLSRPQVMSEDSAIFDSDLVYFSSADKACEAIRHIGEQTLTKYYFGISNEETEE